MNSSYLRFLFASLLVIAIQTWVLSPIALFRVATPFIYPILLLLLPVGIGRISLLLHGFAIGCIIDVLGLTPGLHAAALTATAFVRPMLLRSMGHSVAERLCFFPYFFLSITSSSMR